MAEEIVNRVAKSGILSLDLENYIPSGERVIYDLKDNLFQGMVLKEKDFREFVKGHDWSRYEGKHVGITCSGDAIIPAWAYMLLTVNIKPYADTVILGDKEELEKHLVHENIKNSINPEDYKDARVVVKGCGSVPVSAYILLTDILQPVVKVLMFGEPCSTVPVYKRRKS